MNSKLVFVLLFALLAFTMIVKADDASAVDLPPLSEEELLKDNPFVHPPEEELEPVVPPTHVTEFPAPSVPHKYAILLIENSCKLRKQFTGTRAFTVDEIGFYPDVKVKLVGGLPRVRFFESKDDVDRNTIDGNDYTVDQMMEILAKLQEEPDYFTPKHSVIDVEIARETTVDELKALFEKFGVQRGFTYDKAKMPLLHEDDVDRNPKGKFEVDDVLKVQNPEAEPASAPKDYVFPPDMADASYDPSIKDEL